jgi:hypothetical protein
MHATSQRQACWRTRRPYRCAMGVRRSYNGSVKTVIPRPFCAPSRGNRPDGSSRNANGTVTEPRASGYRHRLEGSADRGRLLVPARRRFGAQLERQTGKVPHRPKFPALCTATIYRAIWANPAAGLGYIGTARPMYQNGLLLARKQGAAANDNLGFAEPLGRLLCWNGLPAVKCSCMVQIV